MMAEKLSPDEAPYSRTISLSRGFIKVISHLIN
jgi:hypothetical protein